MELWFKEIDEANVSYSYKVKDVLYKAQSSFQKIDVIDTEAYGRMLLIDGLVMITEKDEFVYHEMIAHVPALLHVEPKKVLVIGGGDGGTVRELLKHECIQEITLCEIDGMVIDAAKRFFPAVASGLDNPRVEVVVSDGIEFVSNGKSDFFDLVIVDSTDPVGPGEGLFTEVFYRSVARVLAPGGFIVCQSESPWYSVELLGRINKNVMGGFAFVRNYVGSIPTYPRGLWSWTLGSQAPVDISSFDRERLLVMEPHLSYLNCEVFSAAFALPSFYLRKLQALS